MSWLGKTAKLLFIFLSFSFSFGLTIHKKCRKVLYSCSHMMDVTVLCHMIKLHEKCGKIVHRPYSSCISSILVTINLIAHRYSPWCNHTNYFFCFTLPHISNSSVSTSPVGHVLYSADLMSAICFPHSLLMVHRYIYSRYSLVLPMLYQLYHSFLSSTLISSSNLYLSVVTWVTPQGHNSTGNK